MAVGLCACALYLYTAYVIGKAQSRERLLSVFDIDGMDNVKKYGGELGIMCKGNAMCNSNNVKEMRCVMWSKEPTTAEHSEHRAAWLSNYAHTTLLRTNAQQSAP